MQRPLITALALVGACSSSFAQSVTIYGVVDAAVEHVTNVGATGSGNSRMPLFTGSVPSRFGLRGSEDLSNGLRAVFTIEQGLALNNGTLNQGGRTWGRQAFVGLSGSWGTFSLGRQYTMLFWSLLDADILGPNVYGSGSLDSYIPNARADNSIAYRGTFSGLTVGATYSFGRDSVNAGPSPAGTNCPQSAADSKACREWSALVKYDTAGWGVALAVDEIRGGAGAFAGLTSSALKDTRVSANGYFKVGESKIGAGLIRRDNGGSVATPRSDLWYLGANYPVTPQVSVEAEVLSLRFKNSSNKSTLGAARATYQLSKRTALYTTLGYIDNAGALALSVSGGGPGVSPVAGESQIGLAVGIRHSF